VIITVDMPKRRALVAMGESVEEIFVNLLWESEKHEKFGTEYRWCAKV
jgi:hypothetical protein